MEGRNRYLLAWQRARRQPAANQTWRAAARSAAARLTASAFLPLAARRGVSQLESQSERMPPRSSPASTIRQCRRRARDDGGGQATWNRAKNEVRALRRAARITSAPPA